MISDWEEDAFHSAYALDFAVGRVLVGGVVGVIISGGVAVVGGFLAVLRDLLDHVVAVSVDVRDQFYPLPVSPLTRSLLSALGRELA